MYVETGLQFLGIFDDFITSFRPYTIMTWTHTESGRGISFLRSNVFHVDFPKTTSRHDFQICVLYRDNHIPILHYTSYA